MPAAKRLTDRHQRAQEALGLAVARRAASDTASWLSVGDIDTGVTDFIARVVRLVITGRLRSETIAAEYYEALRRENGFDSPRPRHPRRPAPVDRITAGVIYTGPRFAKVLTREGRTDNLPKAVGKAVGKSSMRHTLNAGRLEIFDSVSEDPVAKGFARITDEDPCHWCALLATKGAVYKSEESAGEYNEWHDGCACTVAALFDEDQALPEPPKEAVEAYKKVYADAVSRHSTPGAEILTNKELLANYRKEYYALRNK